MAHFGPVEIVGNKSVGENVIRRELTFKPGDLYRRSLVQDTQRRLYGMELFQFANVEPVNPEQQPAEVPIRVTVAEGNHQRVNFGVGYGTEEKARVDAEYHHLNFLGGARSAGAHARWSSLDRGVRARLQPAVFLPSAFLARRRGAAVVHLHAGVQLDRRRAAKVTADAPRRTPEHVLGGVDHERARQQLDRSPTCSTDPALRNDLIALGLDPITGEQNGTLNALGFDLQHSTADNLLNAHRGYQIAFHAEEAGRLVPGTFNYYAAVGRRPPLPAARRPLVFASRAADRQHRAGRRRRRRTCRSRSSISSAARPASAAGAATRSARSATGLPIGGNSMLAFSEELRATLRGNLGGVLFLDAGNVWADSFGIQSRRPALRRRPGLRYQTPVGPIRFDFGYQLNPIPGLLVNGEPQTRRWRIHFSIGQAF